MISHIHIPERIEKTWGYELIFENSDKYCMKLLHINSGEQTSIHYHSNKQESLMCVSGVLSIRIFNKDQRQEYILHPYEVFTMYPDTVHVLEGFGPCDLVEASTFSSDDDSIRIVI